MSYEVGDIATGCAAELKTDCLVLASDFGGFLYLVEGDVGELVFAPGPDGPMLVVWSVNKPRANDLGAQLAKSVRGMALTAPA